MKSTLPSSFAPKPEPPSAAGKAKATAVWFLLILLTLAIAYRDRLDGVLFLLLVMIAQLARIDAALSRKG